jgi:2-haloacid dehalogenase
MPGMARCGFLRLGLPVLRLLWMQPAEVMLVAAHPFDSRVRQSGTRGRPFIDRPLDYGPDSPGREDPHADLSIDQLHELAARLID